MSAEDITITIKLQSQSEFQLTLAPSTKVLELK
jgi:hypothetical protein